MAGSAAELAVQQANTRMFIMADPENIVISRSPLVDNGAGGKKRGAAVNLPAITVRLVPQNVQGRIDEVQSLDGQMVQTNFHLIAETGSDVQRGDVFYRDGRKHEVIWVVTPGGYEVKAGVTDRG